MGLFGPYSYKSKSKIKWWLHFKDRGKTRIYYFSKDPVGSMSSLPKGYEVIENEKTMLPMLKKLQKKEKKKAD